MDPGPESGSEDRLLPVILSDETPFPDPRWADPEGLVALGGQFSVDRLVSAYRQGIFPWSVHPITWWSPDPRAVIDLNALHIPRSLAAVLRRNTFKVTRNTAFMRVMAACARPGPGREGTWITPEFIDAYSALHRAGHAHSLEVWQGDMLVGGIYGVAQDGLFAGESMFHAVSNASKVALVRLVEHLRERDFELFDIQMLTPVTRLMGATEIAREQYLRRLRNALQRKCKF
jgi:leucyl/phenylalanyl-tRNA--protein transferase